MIVMGVLFLRSMVIAVVSIRIIWMIVAWCGILALMSRAVPPAAYDKLSLMLQRYLKNKFNNIDIYEDELIIGGDDNEDNHSWPTPSERVKNYKPLPIIIANAPNSVELIKQINNNDTPSLLIASWSANSIKMKSNELNNFIADHNPNIIGIQEKHLHPSDNKNPQLQHS
ncbi:hypothetical protein NPIL_93921 [Nephila pilipes]|uniref:Uncharacterized protein n=1 Tax=Nephila pilipes TaxID=299642 RepID=A0A8X6P4S8_NEPPI|nr:hypothetical protein NPIL_93921 [Nephila pilipes]